MSQYGHLYLRCGRSAEAEIMLNVAVIYDQHDQGPSWPKDRQSLLLLKNMAMAFQKTEKLLLAFEALESLFLASSMILGNEDEISTWAAAQLRGVKNRKIVRNNNEQNAVIASTGPKRSLTHPIDRNIPELSDSSQKNETWSEITDEEYRLLQVVQLSRNAFGGKDPYTRTAYGNLIGHYGRLNETSKALIWKGRLQSERTPLHEAVLSRDLHSVEVLLDQGANLTSEDSWGYTPHHLAILSQDKPFVELLLGEGANRTSWTSRGSTLLHLNFSGSDADHNCIAITSLLC